MISQLSITMRSVPIDLRASGTIHDVQRGCLIPCDRRVANDDVRAHCRFEGGQTFLKEAHHLARERSAPSPATDQVNTHLGNDLSTFPSRDIPPFLESPPTVSNCLLTTQHQRHEIFEHFGCALTFPPAPRRPLRSCPSSSGNAAP